MGRDLHVLNRTFLQNSTSNLRYWDPLICLVPYPEPENNFEAAGSAEFAPASAPQRVVGSVPVASAPPSIKLQFKKWERRHEEAVNDSSPLPTTITPSFVPQSTTVSALVFADEVRKMCLLCFRQFDSRDALQDHVDQSRLHESNLEAYRALEEAQRHDYKDRAEERRLVYRDDTPKSGRRCASSARVEKPLSSDNVGAQLLKKMGWREGEGLGAASTGITEPIRPRGRSSRSGIGTSEKRG